MLASVHFYISAYKHSLTALLKRAVGMERWLKEEALLCIEPLHYVDHLLKTV